MSEERLSPGQATRLRVEAGLGKRYARERRFRFLGMLATVLGIAFLAVFFASLVSQGSSAFQQTMVQLDVDFDSEYLAPYGVVDEDANFDAVVRNSLQELFPDVSSRRDRRELFRLVSIGAAFQLQEMLSQDPALLDKQATVWVPVAANVDMLIKGNIDRDLPQEQRPLSDVDIERIDQLLESGRLERHFNWALLNNGDSREPELAGIRGALVGSFYMLIVTIALAFPIGVAAAIYLEEFAPRNRWSDIIEVNINNLAAVPSIVFGLLGLAVFINWLSLPRSAPLVGGLVLSLLTLPVIIIAARAAIKAVPPSIREAALGLGASRMQVIFHHVLPLAMPGMLTGAIIGMARALGETAPLLMIGMIAFIVDVPQKFTDPATALPVQVFLWADSPERAFAERTGAAIIVLLVFLLLMNLAAVLLRRRFERRW
ncbi:MAG TPA: phosphate ABC transporter permease PstA [Woeseiaceae bacterium]